MGEMAEYYLEQAMLGMMDGDDWGCEPRYTPRPKRILTCRLCKKSGLVWGQHEGRWTLFENGAPHKASCRAERW